MSHAALQAASRSLFFSLPVGVRSGGVRRARIWRSSIAIRRANRIAFSTWARSSRPQAFGENDPAVVRGDARRRCRSSTSRYAHSEYQTVAVAAAQGRAEPHRIRPARRATSSSTPAPRPVENAIKSALLQSRDRRRRTATAVSSCSFEGAFHGRTLGSLAVTAPQESPPRLPDVRLAAHSFPVEEVGRRRKRAPRGARA